VHHRPNLAVSIKLGDTSGSHPCSPHLLRLSSHSTRRPLHSRDKKKPPPESKGCGVDRRRRGWRLQPTSPSLCSLPLSRELANIAWITPLFVRDPGNAVAVAIADLCRSRREDFVISASHPSLCMRVPWVRLVFQPVPPPT
jgi:hypothetical protein